MVCRLWDATVDAGEEKEFIAPGCLQVEYVSGNPDLGTHRARVYLRHHDSDNSYHFTIAKEQRERVNWMFQKDETFVVKIETDAEGDVGSAASITLHGFYEETPQGEEGKEGEGKEEEGEAEVERRKTLSWVKNAIIRLVSKKEKEKLL